MEALKIEKWLEVESGSGDGSGDGSGSGYGSGYGSGSGLKSFNGKTVYMIDGIQTIIENIVKTIARGFILQNDLTLETCYVAKGQGHFAHGKTVNEAVKALQEKIFENMDSEEAIEKFMETFEKGKKYSGKDFFEWHHYLTGSCLMGRESFVRDNGLSLETLFTVEEFIALCENAYGGEIIQQLKKRWSDTK